MWVSILGLVLGRAGSTIGQTGQMPGASRLNIKTLLVLHIFGLFTTRQNCRAFSLLRLVYRVSKLTPLVFIDFELLQRIEPNNTSRYDPRIDRNQCIQKFFKGRQRQNFAHPFQVPDDAMQLDVHKTFYLFSPIIRCCLNLNSQSFV